MSRRRQSMPQFAHETLVGVAKRLRDARSYSDRRADEQRPGPDVLGMKQAVALGTMTALVEGAASEIEAILETYPAKKMP